MRFPKLIAGLVLLMVAVGVSAHLKDLPFNLLLMFVNVDQCPEGWEEYEKLRGRFIRGESSRGA